MFTRLLRNLNKFQQYMGHCSGGGGGGGGGRGHCA